MISYIVSYIVNHLSNASILDAPVTIQELCTCLLNSSTDICCTPDRIHCLSGPAPPLDISQVGQTIVVLSAVAAISSPSMLMMCQNAFPGRTNLSAQR